MLYVKHIPQINVLKDSQTRIVILIGMDPVHSCTFGAELVLLFTNSFRVVELLY